MFCVQNKAGIFTVAFPKKEKSLIWSPYIGKIPFDIPNETLLHIKGSGHPYLEWESGPERINAHYSTFFDQEKVGLMVAFIDSGWENIIKHKLTNGYDNLVIDDQVVNDE